jgi:hypothetical protein
MALLSVKSLTALKDNTIVRVIRQLVEARSCQVLISIRKQYGIVSGRAKSIFRTKSDTIPKRESILEKLGKVSLKKG